ncbi:MAG: hypothetical protein K2X91_07055, partial [Thermoleophilia bacterium]|nr:hypothetical protein [Thermoleophilia bacterium]
MAAGLLLIEIAVALGLLAAVALGLEAGYRFGRRASRRTQAHAHDRSEVGAVQGAALGLLALMLGFSFAGASARFVERQDLIVREAIAVATARDAFTLASAAHGERAAAVLDSYVRLKLQQAKTIRRGEPDDPNLDAQFRAVLAELRSLAAEVVELRPGFTHTLVSAVAQIGDLHALRDAAR